MKLLLTSAGIKNASIREALEGMLGKPIEESSALCVPTATYVMPGGAAIAWRFITGRASTPMCELGWKSLGVLELAALPSIDRDVWIAMVQETDAILVNGGDPMYLSYWMKQSGFADVLGAVPGRLRRTERGQHGPGAPRGRGLRAMEAAGGWRHNAGSRRLFDLSASGSRRHADERHGRRRAVGDHRTRTGVCAR